MALRRSARLPPMAFTARLRSALSSPFSLASLAAIAVRRSRKPRLLSFRISSASSPMLKRMSLPSSAILLSSRILLPLSYDFLRFLITFASGRRPFVALSKSTGVFGVVSSSTSIFVTSYAYSREAMSACLYSSMVVLTRYSFPSTLIAPTKR